MNWHSLKLVMLFVITLAMSQGTPGYAQDEPLKRLSRGWEVKGLDLGVALNRVAYDLASTSSPIMLIREGWDETLGVERSKDGQIRIFENDDRPRISIKTNGKPLKQVLDEITAQHGSIVWRFDPDQRVVYITEKHLVSDKRWRLNDPLGDYGKKELTFNQAKDILAEHFGLSLGQREVFLRFRGDTNVIVWRPGEHREKTVRDLIVSLIKYSTFPKYYCFIRVCPEPNNPKNGYEELKSKSELQWNVLPVIINDDITFRNNLDRLEKMKAEKEATKNQPPSDGVFMWNGE